MAVWWSLLCQGADNDGPLAERKKEKMIFIQLGATTIVWIVAGPKFIVSLGLHLEVMEANMDTAKSSAEFNECTDQYTQVDWTTIK